MPKTDGGPAFPNEAKEIAQIVRGEGEPTLITKAIDAQSGMSLRDWFAGKALPRALETSQETQPGDIAKNAAKLAYMAADAMLEHRNKEGEPDAH